MAANGGNTLPRRDRLRQIESMVQEWWDDADVFMAESREKRPGPGEKFFGNFPFPYMNGFLHLGHAFSISKMEFAAAYHRLRGANVLFPFAFHCTGMPIKASADKLAREIEKFGNPPVFPRQVVEEARQGNENPERFKGKKSKAASKSSGQVYQWEIMRSFGLSDSQILEFRDPYKWLEFFPPVAMEDLKAFGLGVDWRRSFVTTDKNPFFDSFVRWQMRKLMSLGKIVKDLRYAIYSPLDGQPCADHDRATGEGVQPQEYTIIKMEVLQPFPPKMRVLEGKKVFLAATLRPETMLQYGKTNAALVSLDGKYGAFEINESDVFILTERAALNLAHQNYSRVPEKPTCLVELTCHDLVELELKSPLALVNDDGMIYALPAVTIPTDKGTGIVTGNIPRADDGKDYMLALQLLKSRYGHESSIKILNSRDSAVEKDFLNMNVIRSKLLETGEALTYSEPEKRVISRSGDECVVALTDQWYITYGEAEWKKLAEQCLANMDLYSDETRHGFEHTLSWLNQWACSRSFGLGTRIPWDEQFLVESLSDSTIYMAYYTVAHLLHNQDMFGTTSIGSRPVSPDQLTGEVWDFIFCGGPYPTSSNIPSSILNKMKQEFEYWYPFDLRVSGKDLIQNHLTFSIYNHTAIMAEHHWPRGFRANGHIMLNSEKMSKSTGNFRTIRQAIEEFSADATRFSLADAGDGLDDANFAFETANAAIMRLTKEISWMEEVLALDSTSLRSGPPSTYADRVFANEINVAVTKTEANYQNLVFREALKTGFYDLQAARDEYRFSCGAGGMNRDLVERFMDVQTRLITPICPHYAEYVWREVLKKEGFVINAGWPTADVPDLTLKKANKYLRDSMVMMRKLLHKQVLGSKRGNKKGAPVTTVTEDSKLVGLIYVNEQFDGWKAECLRMLRARFDNTTRTFTSSSEDGTILEAIQNGHICRNDDFKMTSKLFMPFVRFKKKEATALGIEALELSLPFGEMEVLRENLELIKRQIGVEDLQVLSVTDPDALAKAGTLVRLIQQNPPSPGNPTAIFFLGSLI